MKKLLVTLAVSASLFGCNGNSNTPSYEKNGLFIEARSYTEVKSAADCMPRFNCYAQLSFTPDGEGTVIFSDIANRVTYKIKNERITTDLVGAGDIPKKLEFDIIDSAQTLVRKDNGVIFKLNQSLVEVYKATGAVQCDPTSGTSLTASTAILNKANVTTSVSNCGFLTGIAFPAVCGGGTASVNIHAISSSDLAAAEGLGYKLVTKSSTPIEKTTCP